MFPSNLLPRRLVALGTTLLLLASLQAEPPAPGRRILAGDDSTRRLAIIAPDGSVEWEMEENEEDDSEDGEMEQNPKLVIKAKGIMFPIVVHELIKGYYGMLQSYHGPQDPEESEKIKSATDVLENEMWDIIVGSLLWERMLSAYPMSAFDDNAKEIQSELFVEYTKLIKPEFEKLNKLLHSYNESDRAKAQQIMERIANDIFKKLQQSSLGDNEEDDDYDLDNIDLPEF